MDLLVHGIGLEQRLQPIDRQVALAGRLVEGRQLLEAFATEPLEFLASRRGPILVDVLGKESPAYRRRAAS
jgi:hypothetical protein